MMRRGGEVLRSKVIGEELNCVQDQQFKRDQLVGDGGCGCGDGGGGGGGDDDVYRQKCSNI